MRKSTARTQNYSAAPSPNGDRIRRFHEQMADYARGQRLRELRERTHKSQETVAADIGVSTKTLRTWEQGGKIRWDNAKRLATFYGEEPEALVSRELHDASEDGHPEPSQLDRIEARVDAIYALLTEDGATSAAAAELAALPEQLSQAVAERKRRARERSAKKTAAARRKSA